MQTSDALIACLPPRAYDPSAPEVQRAAAATATVIDDAIQSAAGLRIEHQPDLAARALPDWERNYNLPDTCIGGADAPIDARRLNLLERIRGKGDLSRAFMIDQAEALGYPGCSITESGPMTCMEPCDSPVNGVEFIGVWRLNVPVATAIRVMTCLDPCDSALRSWGNTQLECVINRRKPGGTVAIFGYAP